MNYTRRNPPPEGFSWLKMRVLTDKKSVVEIEMAIDDECRSEIMRSISNYHKRCANKSKEG